MLAANYLRKRLDSTLEGPYDRVCMHEFVATSCRQASCGVSDKVR